MLMNSDNDAKSGGVAKTEPKDDQNIDRTY